MAFAVGGGCGSVLGATAPQGVGSLLRADPYLRSESPPTRANNAAMPARVELGKTLCFDPRLSGSNWISCATYHNPGLGRSDSLLKSLGHGMKPLRRGAPTILNVAFNPLQMWDGRSPHFERQALIPIEGANNMAQDMSSLYVQSGEKAAGI